MSIVTNKIIDMLQLSVLANVRYYSCVFDFLRDSQKNAPIGKEHDTFCLLKWPIRIQHPKSHYRTKEMKSLFVRKRLFTIAIPQKKNSNFEMLVAAVRNQERNYLPNLLANFYELMVQVAMVD